MTGFIVGLLVGGSFGYIVSALMKAAKDEDSRLLNELGIGEDEEIHRK